MLVHDGFLDQFNEVVYDIETNIKNYLSSNKTKKKIVFTGHSLGGALATLASCYFAIVFRDASINCVTFGSPRVGCSNFTNTFNKYCNKSYRFVNENDPVPSLPSSWRFSHVKGCNWINNDKNLNEILPWRFWRFFKNYCLSFIGYGYNAIEDHYCSNYIENLCDLQ